MAENNEEIQELQYSEEELAIINGLTGVFNDENKDEEDNTLSASDLDDSSEVEQVSDLDAIGEEASQVSDLDAIGQEASQVPNLDTIGEEASQVSNLDAIGEEASQVPDLDAIGEEASQLSNLDTIGEEASQLPDLDTIGEEASRVPNLDTIGEEASQVPNLDTIGEEASQVPDLDAIGEEASQVPDLDAIGQDDFQVPDLDAIGNFSDTATTDIISNIDIESTATDTASGMSLEELSFFREALKRYPFRLQKVVITTLVEEKLGPDETKQLISLVLENAEQPALINFVENNLGFSLDNLDEPRKAHKIILSKPEFEEDILSKRERMLHRIRIGAMATLFTLTVLTTTYYSLIKPNIYKYLIRKGKQSLLLHSPKQPDISSIGEAEKRFQQAIAYYPSKVFAYLQYANAYQAVGMYDEAFEKLFGKIEFTNTIKNYTDNDIKEMHSFWRDIQGIPIIRYITSNNHKNIFINGIIAHIHKKGAYLKTHLDGKKDDAYTLIALGKFHTNLIKRFRSSLYFNNLLGIDYFNKILTFETSTPLFHGNKVITHALSGIGNVYYNQGDYFRANKYFHKIIKNNPKGIMGHTGILRSLLAVYAKDHDPRIVIEYHNRIRHTLDLEEELPLHLLAQLISFYIDLPDDDHLRIKYNIAKRDLLDNVNIQDKIMILLNILYHSKEKDIYGNVIYGKEFAEGYYQRARYYRKIEKENKMALKQLEYAYKFNPKHYLALNTRAEILMEFKDYDLARKTLELAMRTMDDATFILLGSKPEDEVLIKGDAGRVYFNYGKVLYLKLIDDLSPPSFSTWQRMQEVDRYNNQLESGLHAFTTQLDKIDKYFDKAEEIKLGSMVQEIELNYYRGWSYYIRGNFRRSLAFWEQIPLEESMADQYKNIELAKANALYKLGAQSHNSINKHDEYLKSALGHLLFLQNFYEIQLNKIGYLNNSPTEKEKELINRLSIINNNLGSTYELLKNENKAIQHYWKSIKYARNISEENEVARYNLRLSFKRSGLLGAESMPLLMDFIPPLLKIKG